MIHHTVFTLILISLFSYSTYAGWEPIETTVRDPVQEAADWHNSGGTYQGTKTGEYYGVSEPVTAPTRNPHDDQREQMDRAAAQFEARQRSDDSRERRAEAARRRAEAAELRAEELMRVKAVDPWAPYREYDAGEFGDVGDMDVHHNAMAAAQAAAQACAMCSESAQKGDPTSISARRAVVNANYAAQVQSGYDTRQVPNSERNIPAGPMAAARKYGEQVTTQSIRQRLIEERIDAMVINGEVGFYYPGQAPIRSDENLTATQRLGQQESITLLPIDDEAYDSLTTSISNQDMESARGYASSSGNYPGGLIVIRSSHPTILDSGQTMVTVSGPIAGSEMNIPFLDPNNAVQNSVLRHEFSHSGERAIANIVQQQVQSGASVSKVLSEGQAIAKSHIVAKDYFEIRDTEYGAEATEPDRHYVNQYTEFEAFLHMYEDPESGRERIESRLESDYGLTPARASLVFQELRDDPVRQERRQKLDEAANQLLDQ